MKNELTDSQLLTEIKAAFARCPKDEDVEVYLARAVIALALADKDAEIAALTKQNNAYKTLTESLDIRMAVLLAERGGWIEAVATLASERQANAMLTDEIAALKLDAERLDYLEARSGYGVRFDDDCKARLKFGWNDGLLRDAIDKAIAQAVQPL